MARSNASMIPSASSHGSSVLLALSLSLSLSMKEKNQPPSDCINQKKKLGFG